MPESVDVYVCHNDYQVLLCMLETGSMLLVFALLPTRGIYHKILYKILLLTSKTNWAFSIQDTDTETYHTWIDWIIILGSKDSS